MVAGNFETSRAGYSHMSNSPDALPIIGFAGLTHLGINSLAAAAERGFCVIGFEEDESLISNLNRGIVHVEEPGLLECLSKNKNRITYTTKKTDLATCDVVYISTDVPTNDSGESDLQIVHQKLNVVLDSVKDHATIVVLCQVNPGFTRCITTSRANVFYQVETLVFGNAMQRALSPERLIVGSKDPASPLPRSYAIFLESFSCPILLMKYESAELSKIAINMFLISTVSTTNMLAEVCENIGASWSEIAPALKLDKRIGQYAYLKPGLGISGGNLERDIATIRSISEDHGLQTDLSDSWISLSKSRKSWAFEQMSQIVDVTDQSLSVGVLGLAYKENTHSTKNSPSLELIRKLEQCRVRVYDPVVKNIPLAKVEYAYSVSDLLSDIDILAVMTPWDDFKFISEEEICSSLKKKLLIDPYGLFAGLDYSSKGISYRTLGERGE